jgi:hypothetical protein
MTRVQCFWQPPGYIILRLNREIVYRKRSYPPQKAAFFYYLHALIPEVFAWCQQAWAYALGVSTSAHPNQ